MSIATEGLEGLPDAINSVGGPERPTTTLIVMYVVALIGIALFTRWLVQTSLGRKALLGSKPRRNCMDLYIPLAAFLLWIAGAGVLLPVARAVVGPVEGWRSEFVENLVLSAVSLATAGIILVIAALNFARGLRGFGLRLRTIPKDLALAFAELLAVLPLVQATIVLTASLGQLLSQHLWGKDFQMPQHEGLELITESTALPLQVLIIILAVVIAPLVEELLFRGLFQTMVRSYLRRPWTAIAITSLLFAMTHQDPEHWPALFVLAMGLGYSYEKSGSLFRPIFMHALFNGAIIASTLLESAAK